MCYLSYNTFLAHNVQETQTNREVTVAVQDHIDDQQHQVKLILMLYDGVIKLLNDALDGMKKNKFDLINDSLVQAQKIITELMLSLDLDVGETALNLFILYDSFHEKLLEANVHKNAELMKEVRETLIGLRKIWEQAALLDMDKVQSQKIQLKKAHKNKLPPPVKAPSQTIQPRKKANGEEDFGF